ncbi:alpha/beta-hydrolase [Glonium stellatum]|uniref:Alpha/beta-hydrolase n=1 Tax=Glonium stellatum TaxID=574774 RepID=A0A8E2ERR6_9PEZI|nr:alpha/beta-hydrolase [Glonium stellatum]
MVINTISVGAAVTPTVIQTWFSHYLNRKPLRHKPTAHISYHEGLQLVRQFLHYASFHTVDDIQAFTSQWVPVPRWVKVDEVEIPKEKLSKAAEYIQAQLGPEGIQRVGGKTWWQWRRDDSALKAEWIEMRNDYHERKRAGGGEGQRIMLYVHGGAYYFGSVDEHRYQMQRHARKLKARVLAPRYRLAPQYPFPCALYDCLAAYLYLLERHDPSTIVLAGDSAGGGMVVSMLVTLRDQGVPLPAGAILISPWVDLTHSFPSLGGKGELDYIPAHGFVHKPCMSWPPPNADDLLELEARSHNPQRKDKKAPHIPLSRSGKEQKAAEKQVKQERVRGFSVHSEAERPDLSTLKLIEDDKIPDTESNNPMIGHNSLISITINGNIIEIKDQIQIYAANHLITHPLVSPVLQPTLGGLPPLLIQVGGGELLRDEQIYLAHKAADPLSYLPAPSAHLSAESISSRAAMYRPTNVQLQVWDDLCHVAPTLSFTRPAKYMYRSIAQFGAWALARAQKTSIDILDDDDVSIISSTSSSGDESDGKLSPDDIKLSMPRSAQNVGFERVSRQTSEGPTVGKAGDPLPPFENHMIRQRIDRHGNIHALPPPTEIEALKLSASEIGTIKPGPVQKWMTAQRQWNEKFARQKRAVQKKRIQDMERGFEGFEGETPPPTALAGRRVKGMDKEKAKKKSWGMSLWSVWGSKHDMMTIEREKKGDTDPGRKTVVDASHADGAADTKARPKTLPKSRRRASSTRAARLGLLAANGSRSRSHHSTVTDRGQADADIEHLEHLAPPTPGYAEATPAATPLEIEKQTTLASSKSRPRSPPTIVPQSDTHSVRPTRDGIAYPFKLAVEGEGRDVNASTVTLNDLQDDRITEEDISSEDTEKADRPGIERFVTAQEDLS